MRKEFYIQPSTESAPAPPSGPLGGCRICLQPNLAVRGWRMEAGSRALENHVATEDAFVVERLRSQGAILAGSVHMAELGFGTVGDATAPAVREDCDAGLVTDAFGECRVMAVAHGLAGFKPSQGMVSRRGLAGLIPSMECISIVAREVASVSKMFRSIAVVDEQDASMRRAQRPDFPVAGATANPFQTVGVIQEAVALLSETEQGTFRRHLDRAAAKGLAVREVSVKEFTLFRKAHQVIGAVEASSSAGKYDGVRYGHRAAGTSNWNEMYLKTRAENFGTLVKSYLFQGAYFQFKDFDAFQDACRIRNRLLKTVESLFGQVDVLALPVRRPSADPARARTVEDVYDAFEMTLPANLLGLPAAVFPGPEPADAGDPGLQWVAPTLRDADVLSLGAVLAD